MLIIITDGSTGTNKEAIKMSASNLIASGIIIIPVALGPVPVMELEKEIPGEAVIKTNLTDNPEKIGDKIMMKATSGQ